MGTGFGLTWKIAAMLVLAALVQPAYAITDCTSIDAPGAYALENDITDTAALKCINITVSNVSLDGAGFTVDGVDTASGAYGIYVYNGSATLDNVTIGNVTVTDFSEGIFFNSVENGSILNCTLALNVRDGAWLNSSGYNSLSNNTVYNNSIYGIYITGSPDVELRDNTLYYQNGSNDAGIYADRADNIGIHGSMFYDNWLGAYIRNSTSVSISNSSFLRHGKEAMRIINVSGGNITGNYANMTVEQVIQLGESSLTSPGVRHVVIAGNRFYGVGEGIRPYHNSENITIVNNEVRDALFALAMINNHGNYVVNNTLVGLNYDFLVTNDDVDSSYCNHFVENNTGYGGKAIFYSNETSEITGEGYSVIEICGANNSVIRDVLINGDPAYGSNQLWIEMSGNVTVINVTLNNTFFGLSVWGHSSGFYGENISIYNAYARGIAMGRMNDTLLRNIVIDASGFIGGGTPNTEAGGGFTGIIMYSNNNATVENAVIVNNSKYFYLEYKELSIIRYSDDDLPSSNNTFRNITIYGSTQHFYHNESGLDNVLQNFSICRNSSAAGCVKWGSVDLDSTYAQINYSGLFTEGDFVSLNSSEASLDLFNSSANITLEADCSPSIIYSVFRKENFPSSSADILANGTLYAPTRMECSNDYLTFGVTSFSGYALQEGSLNLSILPSNTVLSHTETNASCIASNPAVMLELYRNGVLVANGTSYIEDVQNLTAGTYAYVCNTTNYTTVSATGTLVVRGLGTGGSTSPMTIIISGGRVVGSTLTITVRDGSTPVDGAEVRILYWSNGILNAINLGNTNSDGEVEFTPTIAGEYTVEATTAGYGAVEFAFSVEAAEEQGDGNAEQEAGNGMPGTGCGNGCPAGYGCIDVSCVMIGGQQGTPSDEEMGTGGILPVVASPAWESTGESPADREVSSGPGQAASPPRGEGEPINPLLIVVPLAVAVVLVLLSRRRKK